MVNVLLCSNVLSFCREVKSPLLYVVMFNVVDSCSALCVSDVCIVENCNIIYVRLNNAVINV